jgi:hypothetical protein
MVGMAQVEWITLEAMKARKEEEREKKLTDEKEKQQEVLRHKHRRQEEIKKRVRNFSSFCPILLTLLTFDTYLYFQYRPLFVKYFRMRCMQCLRRSFW